MSLYLDKSALLGSQMQLGLQAQYVCIDSNQTLITVFIYSKRSLGKKRTKNDGKKFNKWQMDL